jgi:plasmid stabilization system protein ParE
VKKRLRAPRRVWAQLDRASKWWRRHRDKAPDAFDADFADAFDRIRSNPDIGTPVRSRKGDARSLWLDRIGYFVFYRVLDTETVEIIAIWHSSRGSRPKL